MASQEVSNGVMDSAEESKMSALLELSEGPMDVDCETATSDGVQAEVMTGSSNPTQANERLLFCAEVLIGYKCEVQVRLRGSTEPLETTDCWLCSASS